MSDYWNQVKLQITGKFLQLKKKGKRMKPWLKKLNE